MLDLIAKTWTVERDGLPREFEFCLRKTVSWLWSSEKVPSDKKLCACYLSIVGRGMLWDILDPNYHPKRLSDLQTKSASISFLRKTLLNILPSLNHRGCQPHWQAGELGTIYLYFINYETIHAFKFYQTYLNQFKIVPYLFSGQSRGSLIGSDKGEVYVLIFSCGKVWLSIILVLFVNMPNLWKIVLSVL